MAKYKDEFKFKLSKPIKYQAKTAEGYGFKECSELILRAPNLRSHYRIGNILQALFTPALLKAQKTMLELVSSQPIKKGKQEVEINDEEANKTIVNFGILSIGKDINDFYDNFEKLLISENICFLDNNVQFTETELNEIDNEDFKQLTTEYTSNFFIVSWMRSLGGK